MGTRLPPLKKLAKELGAGHRSLLRAIEELRDEGWVESSPRRGTIVCDPRRRDRADSSKVQAGVVGRVASILVAQPADNDFALAIAQPLQERLAEAGMTARLVSTTSMPANAQIENLTRYGGDAVCIINPCSWVPLCFAPTQTLLAISSAPELRVQATGRFDVVSVDHVQGAAIAGWRLREIGCRRIAYLGMGAADQGQVTFDAISAARLSGLEQGLGEVVPPQWRLACKFYDYASAAAVVRDYLQLSPRPDGLFAASDELAIGFVAGATAHGLTAGVDYQIIGFDGQPAGNRIACGPLTTIDVHPQKLGATGAQLLIERLLQPELPSRRILLGGSLRLGRTARQQPNPDDANDQNTPVSLV